MSYLTVHNNWGKPKYRTTLELLHVCLPPQAARIQVSHIPWVKVTHSKCLQITLVENHASHRIKIGTRIAQSDEAKRMEAGKDVNHGGWEQSVLAGTLDTPLPRPESPTARTVPSDRRAGKGC